VASTHAQHARIVPVLLSAVSLTSHTHTHTHTHTPQDTIHEYFGPRVAIYFLFVSHYTTALIWPTLWGFFAFAYGMAFFSVDPNNLNQRRPVVDQVCASELPICGVRLSTTVCKQ
jgi:hypothetical protein